MCYVNQLITEAVYEFTEGSLTDNKNTITD